MVTSDRQLGLLPEGCDERLAALCSPQFGTGKVTQLGEVSGTEICQFVMLPVRPEVFDWVQLRCIGRQELQVDATVLAFDIFADQSTAMRLEPIPDNQQLSVAEMPTQRFEEGDDFDRPHCTLHQFEIDVPEADPRHG